MTTPSEVSERVRRRWPEEAWRYPAYARFANRCLDPLPWPIGQELIAMGWGASVIAGTKSRQALAWAAEHRSTPAGRWRLAYEVLANRARFHAISALVGARHPATLRARITIVGREHLDAAVSRGPTLLLGFHLGPPGTFLALRLCGYPLVFVGLLDVSGRWDRAAWAPLLDPEQTIPLLDGDPASGLRALQRARRVLAGRGTVLTTGDGPLGDELFRVPVPGGEVIMRRGWFALRRLSGATTLPILAHWRPQRRVIEISPPLPPVERDGDRDARGCQSALAPILSNYVRTYPEQCPLLAFWTDGRPPGSGGDVMARADTPRSRG